MYSNESGEPVNPLDADLEALKVHVMNSEVVLLGPRVAVALSADAAAETARRLAAAAAQSRGLQRVREPAAPLQPPPSKRDQASQTCSREA